MSIVASSWPKKSDEKLERLKFICRGKLKVLTSLKGEIVELCAEEEIHLPYKLAVYNNISISVVDKFNYLTSLLRAQLTEPSKDFP